MKFISRFFVSILFIISLKSVAYSCAFLNERIGGNIEPLLEKYELLRDPYDAGINKQTLLYEYRTKDFCDDSQLKDTYLEVYIKDNLLVGFRLETLYSAENNLLIYDYANRNYGLHNEKVFDKQWIGASVVISGDKQIIYGKLNDGEDKYFETLNISTREFTDEMNNAIPVM